MPLRFLLLITALVLAAPTVAWAWPKPIERFERAAPAVTVSVDHGAWDRFLGRYVRRDAQGLNRVAYGAVTPADKAALQAYLDRLQATDVDRLTRDQQMAFWINLYNAATVDLILDNYPVKSIRELGVPVIGPWKIKRLTVGGRRLSLDDVEHGILRPIWRDVRIHYAVNCAAIGCPNLAMRAYTAENLEAMLEAGARAYVNSPRGFARVGGKLVASSIYAWYRSDWGSDAEVLAHARRYATGETASLLRTARRIDGHRYDWSLNDAR
jgi:hypothetical protein